MGIFSTKRDLTNTKYYILYLFRFNLDTMTDIAIGIDLGTSYTVAVVYREGQAEIIPNTDGHRLTPSVVFYNPADPSDASVGKLAQHFELGTPRNFIFDTKRIIGRSYFDAYVQDFITTEARKTFSLDIVNTADGVPCIKLETQDPSQIVTVSPEEVSAEILKYIKHSAKTYLGCDIVEAVISVPAYFSYAQKEATKRAAESVGFKVLKLFSEPVAAAIYYALKKNKHGVNLLMVDLGGGTLDVSVITYRDDEFVVKAIEGDMFLGGRDFDDILFKYLRVKFEERLGTPPIDPRDKKGFRLLHRFRKFAIKFKHILSTKEKCAMLIDLGNGEDFNTEITRETFEKGSENLFQRIMNKVQQCLVTAKMSESDISKVVLAGGSTRIPKIKELLSVMFQGIEVCTDLNPDEVVALGASIHAALLKNETSALGEYRLTEVAPMSLGILTKYDLMVRFIEKGETLPVTITRIMGTSKNDQKSAAFMIYEGEWKKCQHNKKLGEFLIRNLPCGRAGEIKFEVSFSLDQNGLIRVSAQERSTGTASQLKIEMENLTVYEKATFLSLEYEHRLRDEDKLYYEYYTLKINTDTYCKRILYSAHNCPELLPRKDLILREINAFFDIVENSSDTNIESLRSAFQNLKRSMGPLIGSRYY